MDVNGAGVYIPDDLIQIISVKSGLEGREQVTPMVQIQLQVPPNLLDSLGVPADTPKFWDLPGDIMDRVEESLEVQRKLQFDLVKARRGALQRTRLLELLGRLPSQRVHRRARVSLLRNKHMYLDEDEDCNVEEIQPDVPSIPEDFIERVPTRSPALDMRELSLVMEIAEHGDIILSGGELDGLTIIHLKRIGEYTCPGAQGPARAPTRPASSSGREFTYGRRERFHLF